MSDTLPSGWARTRIGDVCDVVGGSTPRTGIADNWGGDVAWVTPDDLSRHVGTYIRRGRRSLTQLGYESCSATLMPRGAVIFSSRAPIGYVAIASGPVCTNQGCKSFVPPEGLLSEYLYWYLRHATPVIQAMGTGTTFKEISKATASSIQLEVPPLAEQKRIVAAIEEHFSRLDAAEAATDSSVNRIPSLLEAAVQAQLHKYPTSSAPLHRFLIQRLSNGRSVPTAKTDGFPVLRLTCLREGTVATSETKQGDFGDVDPTRYVIEPDDFLISRGNGSLHLVGLGGVVPARASSVAYPDTLIRARVDQSRLRPSFLSHIWNSRLVRKQLEAQARTTAGIYKINQTMIEQVSLPIPSPDDQDKIAQQLDELKASVRMTEREVERARQRIAELRRSVLTAAFSGRLVPQDPDDEPASVLLERIALSRAATPARRRARA